MEISPETARQIIETVGGHGTPPEWGIQLFTAGLGAYLQVIEEDYLKTYINRGGSSFKMVVGAYGGGKTHFLYNVRELAWKHGFVVSYASLSHDESPFHKMDRVYRAIAMNLMYPMTPEELMEGSEKGVGAFIKVWFSKSFERLSQAELDGDALREALHQECRSAVSHMEGSNFAMAVKQAFMALADEKHDVFDQVLQWLTADGFDRNIHREYGILRPIDRGNAFSAIRSMVRWVQNLGYQGLVILLDEAEQMPSMSSRQREIMLSNLRELIDECGQSSFRNVMVFYAVPGESFLDGHANVYEALKQRVSSIFEFVNPSGVKIVLERLGTDPVAMLEEIGSKLAGVFERAYGVSLPPETVGPAVRLTAGEAYERRFGDIGYKRLFVQAVVRAFHSIARAPGARVDAAWVRGLMEGVY